MTPDPASPESAELLLPFSAGGNQYLGVLNAAGTRWNGVCVLVPGSGPIDADGQVGANRYLHQLSQGLAVRGIASLRLGKRIIGPKNGPVETYAAEYLEPLRALLDAARRVEPRMTTLALAGHSLGGHVAPYLAANVQGVKGVALLSAHLDDLVTIFRWQLERLEPPERAQAADVLRLLDEVETAPAPEHFTLEHARYLWHARRHDPRSFLAGLGLPFFCLAGAQDMHIPEQQLDAWERALRAGGLSVQARRYPGLDHLLMPARANTLTGILEPGDMSGDVLDDLAGWVATLG